MKCLACDDILTDEEATRKYESSGEFIDLCNVCFAEIADQLIVVESEYSSIEKEPEDVHEG